MVARHPFQNSSPVRAGPPRPAPANKGPRARGPGRKLFLCRFGLKTWTICAASRPDGPSRTAVAVRAKIASHAPDDFTLLALGARCVPGRSIKAAKIGQVPIGQRLGPPALRALG